MALQTVKNLYSWKQQNNKSAFELGKERCTTFFLEHSKKVNRYNQHIIIYRNNNDFYTFYNGT
ncbi:hypothetical protein GCM10007966_08310 [Legionella impletisoli]|uniref:Uncharacterized protein n=1 Tax=Legionella impletisoli TaxID=343510 RepID=A0A917JSB9_9GAMM|nr:hypothetical protein GCM10007966_08310 [Legionella impletisoli]